MHPPKKTAQNGSHAVAFSRVPVIGGDFVLIYRQKEENR